MEIIKKKICILGSFGVGKTSLIRRFVYNAFEESYLTTIGVNISQKRITPDISITYDFLIWDIEGHEKFSPVIESYYTGASGAILVTDLTRADSLDNIDNILSRFQLINPNSKFVFCANKTDLITSTEKNTQKFISWAETKEMHYFLTSAKDNKNVEAAFTCLAGLL